jgi:FkbM family methyltransferase
MGALGSARRVVERNLPRLAMTYRYVRDLWQSMTPSRQTPLGFSFVGSVSMQDGTFEATEVAIIRRLLEDCNVLVNIGANAGYYCCIAAQAGKSVIAFEPLPENVRLLLRNVHDNGYEPQVEIFPLGLGSTSGIATLYGGGTGASLTEGWAGVSNVQARLIPVSSADLILGNRLDGEHCLVIMDIEGAELQALRGSRNLLSQAPKPIWMVEIVGSENRDNRSGFNADFEATFEMFWSHGYETWTAEDNPRKITRDDVAKMSATQTSLGVYNYLFVDPSARPGLLSVPSEGAP